MNHQQILHMDLNDPLANKREEFDLPENKVYLNGNSLGPLPIRARQRAQQVIDQQWGQDLIASWNLHQWIDLPTLAGEKIARLLGAQTGQVICCDSVSINLFKLLACALQLRPHRRTVLSQKDNFPTDLYITDGLRQLLGERSFKLVLVEEQEIETAIQNDVGVLLLTQVNFRSGKAYDMQRLTQLAHQHGALVIWDLAHSVGVLPVQLDNWNVDFAVGCGYKYLNGGPGAPAFLYTASRHLGQIKQPLQGWMGHKAPFEFDWDYQSDQGIRQFLCGTPPIISMSVLDAALDVFADVNVEQLRDKSMGLMSLFLDLVEADAALASLELLSPRQPELRGSHLAFAHASAYALCQALSENGIVTDYRSPNILRLGFSPLFLRYQDVWHSVQVLSDIIKNSLYNEERFNREIEGARVT